MTLSDAEREANQLTDENLTLAVNTFMEQGLIILESVIPEKNIKNMQCLFEEETKRQFKEMGGEEEPETVDAKASKTIFKSHYKGLDRDVRLNTHRGIRVPMDIRFFDPLIVENPFAMQILKALSGEDVYSRYPYQSNTAWPGCPVQDIHRDSKQLTPSDPYVPSETVINIPLVDFTEENGATEIWPCSHLTVDERLPEPGELERRAEGLPSIRATMPAGSILIRDKRCWHRGMANNTDIQRVMIAHVCSLSPFKADQQIIPHEIWDQLSSQVQRLYRNLSPE